MGCISEISDDILIDIVSRLSLKEAARTRAVCSRWEKLFKFYSGYLDFDSLEFPRCVDWVNQVLSSLDQAQTVEGFRVCFESDTTHTAILDSWTRFAAAKGVRRLELDLKELGNPFKSSEKLYCFRPTTSKGSEWKALTSLVLDSVNVDEQHLLHLLSHCPEIEKLSISYAPSLHNFRLPSANHKLKHLGIMRCKGLESIEVVSASNLCSFEYQGPGNINMLFRDVPRLSSVTIRSDKVPYHCSDLCEDLVRTRCSQVPFPVSQLQVLVLDLELLVLNSYFLFPETLDQLFSNLQQLELQFDSLYEQSFLFLCSLIHASPCLRKLIVKHTVSWLQMDQVMELEDRIKFGDRSRHWVEGHKYKCLKEVEFLGWVGFKNDVEFVLHLIQAAGPSLESLTLDTHEPDQVGELKGLAKQRKRKRKRNQSGELCDVPTKLAARIGVRTVQTKLSPRTKLIVL